MAEVKEGPEGWLEVMMTWPRMSGYAGPAWPQFCNVYVGVGGMLVASRLLPFEMDKEDVEEDINENDLKRYVRARAIDDMKQWRLALRVPVASDWPGLSLDIFVERADYDVLQKNLVVTRGGPHTSGYTAVIGRARVPLLDALVTRGVDEEEEEEAEENNKRRRNKVEERHARLEGTVEFGKTVPLLDWELPSLRDVHGMPRSVVRGTVDVRMCLRKLN
ncbi:hypothetical protein BAE44_0024951 [Dichanthelium oligosanthes]|uniref:Uncharacterized protein n=1 Tax=Dichanthelium oligosanthes TaxID=888268 RepID=A0A1E5UMD0_9POAL|nr:hypothetical protein BAE44_0024951 [Dichanthelium oligosanthes]